MKLGTYRSSLLIIVIALMACLQWVTPASAAITQVGQWGSGPYEDVFVDGSYAYCAAGATGIDIINISDTTNPMLVSNLKTSGVTTGVYVNANCAYVADYYAGLEVIDISTPAGTYTWHGHNWLFWNLSYAHELRH